ncbi:related to major facilitator MirA [Cephalotrichum gorgonifer]|uniref:Related to major facilitator MirA n=1 Tax=Cephalotrichum gorgonifer TaxID=2041049 RepID=A0AAE8SVA7_9PEZI|nr:related to major facilitator MirA [Cephalotrichum gorgonifer]
MATVPQQPVEKSGSPPRTTPEEKRQNSLDDEKALGTEPGVQHLPKSDDEDEFQQDGVKRMAAITSTWSYKALIATYILIYICSYTHSMQQQMPSNLGPYVTSSFQKHGLTAMSGIVARLVAGVSQLPLAKIINIWGRMEGYILAHFFCSLGLLLMAVSHNVETYAAAQVFWQVGSGGIGYIHTVLISDTTSLRNRMIIYTLNSTAYIGNAWAGPIVAQLFYTHSNFRWAYGAFAIIFPFVGSTVCFMLWWNLRKAKRLGLVPKRTASGRNWKQSTLFYCEQCDIIGMFLIVVGFSLVLLPFSLVVYARNGWKTGYIIAMPIIGLFLLAAFFVWEKRFASTPLAPWHLLRDRTILGAAAVAGVIAMSFGSWDSYFSSYLQVVHRRTIAQAGLILNIYTIASCTWGPIVGFLIRQTNHFKWIALCAIPVAALATGLLIHFRTPDAYIGYIIMCQILKAVSSGTIIICEQLAVMSVVKHNEVTVMLALIALTSHVGGSVGRAISGGIWTNQLPGYLDKYLPAEDRDNAMTIYGSLPVQLAYEWGSEAREAINRSYGDVQRHMVIAGACFMPLAFACVLLWRNVNVGKTQQTRGQVF